MNLTELIPELKNYNRIMITGSQRSGTTIATKIIAHEMGFKALYEEDINSANLEAYFKQHFKHKQYVLQGTGLTYICHDLPVDCVVYMIRSNKDVMKSIKRINWMKYNQIETMRYWIKKGKSWEIKKKHWEIQKKMIENWYELDYESMSEHELWIDKKLRKNFGERQTEL